MNRNNRNVQILEILRKENLVMNLGIQDGKRDEYWMNIEAVSKNGILEEGQI